MHDLQMKENMTSKDVRFHHRICEAQKHLRQGTGNVINLSRNQGKMFELVLEVIKDLQLSNKSNFIDVRDLPIKENITSKDVRFHHRICDAQKHLVQGTGNFIHLSKNQGILFE